MAHTFDELVERQQAANAAHREVLRLRDEYGPPTAGGWAETQTATYETAWRAWRDLARDTQAAVMRFPRDAEDADSGSDGTHERNIDHGCPQEVLA
ncbi:hypothetical protein ACFVY0_43750, partial [Streptomyces sp. NPDC058286]|uniref:hypothetical protein n=1 Tax=Streptomyces sp. NPDC058286 TaxID=3346422 RepID=UPI0036E3ABF4